MRCYWCDNDAYNGVSDSGDILPLPDMEKASKKPKDYACTWCGHLVSEPNPRAGDPKETIESLKEERDDIRAQLEAATAELQQNDEA